MPDIFKSANILASIPAASSTSITEVIVSETTTKMELNIPLIPLIPFFLSLFILDSLELKPIIDINSLYTSTT